MAAVNRETVPKTRPDRPGRRLLPRLRLRVIPS